MKKYLIIVGLCLSALISRGQQGYYPNVPPGTNPITSPTFRSQSNTIDSLQGVWLGILGKYYRIPTLMTMRLAIAQANPTITGFTITSLPTVGQVITQGTVQNVFQQLYQQEPIPNATFTPASTILELTSNSTSSVTFSYSYSKNTGNTNFISAKLNGSTTGITQNANGTSGTTTQTFNSNITQNFTFLVNTSSQSKSVLASVSFQPKRYWGRNVTQTLTSSAIVSSTGGSNSLTTSRAGTFTITASGSNYLYYSYPASEGALTSITVGGLESLTSFTQSTISLTNASGYTQDYFLYVSNNPTSANATLVTN